MKKYLSDYIAFIESWIEDGNYDDIEFIKREHLTQIQFMQHERLIHFLVTFMFAVIFVISVGIFVMSELIMTFVLSIVILCLLIPYIKHYYFLENSVQKLYAIYNRICSLSENKNVFQSK